MAISLPDLLVTTAPAASVLIVLPALTAGRTLIGHGTPGSGSLVVNPSSSLTYTPAAGFVGEDEFTYTLRDAVNIEYEGRVVVTVARSNNGPVVGNDSAATTMNTPVLIPVLANDNDPDGSPLLVVALETPAHGTVSVQPDNRLRYTPQKGFTGTDSFAYTVSDLTGATGKASVSVTVAGTGRPPVARNDALTTTVGTSATVALLANDNDPDGDPLQLVSLGLPQHGTLKVNGDQTVTYTPEDGYVGTDEFTYVVGDGKGGTAEGRVSLRIERPNQAPVLADDVLITPVNTPATISMLANDNDPDGDPLRLTGLGLPQQGTLAVNPDRTLTYTPKPGFAGTDGFTYTVADGWGGRATARVAVQVGDAADLAYPNGYSYRRRMAVPAALIHGVHAGFPFWFRLTAAWLKPASSGGRLAGGSHLDVRFELEDGTKLPHEIESHDPATGTLQAWVRLPLLSTEADTRLFIYYGKADLAESEADPTAVWADYLGVWHLPALTDRGPGARALTAAGTVAEDGGGLNGALRLAGTGTLGRTDAASWLGGLAGITVQVRAKADAIGNERGLLNAGSFDDAASGITLRQAGADGAFFAKLKTSAGDLALTTRGGLQSTSWRSLALGWAAGDARLGLYVDGARAETVATSDIGTGTNVTTAIAGALTLGAGARDGAAGGWQGLIDEIRIRSNRLSEGWLAAEHANQSSPDTFFGLGAEDSPDDVTLSPVAVPIRIATLVNAWVDVDVLSRAVNAPGRPTPSLISVGQPANGLASIIDGRVRYTPTIGFVGTDSFVYTLGAGAKRTTSRITVSVQRLDVSLPAPRRSVPVSSSLQLTAALAAAQEGDHILLADGTYGGSFTAALPGSPSDPVVIRAVNPLGAKLTGAIQVTGEDVWLWGLTLEGASVELAANRARMSRCRQSSTTGIAVLISRGDGVEVDYNELFALRERGVSVRPDMADPGAVQNPYIHHNFFHDITAPGGDGTSEAVQVGQLKAHTDLPVKARIEHNLFENVGVDGECVSLRSSDNVVAFNTVLNCRSRLVSRHGERNEITANWIEGSHGLRAFDRSGKLLGNRLIGTASGIQVMAGNVTALNWPGSGTDPAATDWLLAGNNADATVVGFSLPGLELAATNTRIEAHVGPVAQNRDTGTTQVPTTALTIPAARRLGRVDVGPHATPVEVEPPIVTYDLAPDWTQRWVMHKAHANAGVSQLATGVRMLTPDSTSDPEANGVALWSKVPVEGDFELSWRHKVTQKLSVSDGSLFNFYFDVLGEGTTAWPQDITAWSVGSDDQLPIPTNTVTARTTNEIQKAINDHGGGVTKIIVEDGTYAGSINVSKSNILLYGRTINGARFTSRMTIGGSNSVVARLWLPKGIDVRGDGSRVSRCKVDGIAVGEYAIRLFRPNTKADGNHVVNCPGGIWVSNNAKGAVITRNWVHDQLDGTTGSNDVAIYIGESPANSAGGFNVVASYNRTENWRTHQHLEVKGGDVLVHGHTARGNGSSGPVANVYCRNGVRVTFSCCWGHDAVFGMSDKDNLAVRCKTLGSDRACVAFRSGQISGDELRAGQKGIVYSTRGIARRCEGKVQVGWDQGAGPKPPLQSIVEDCPEVRVEKGTYTTRAVSGPVPDESPRELIPDVDVGQFWQSTSVPPTEELYSLHARGLRLTGAVQDPGNANLNDRLRLRWFEFTTNGTGIGTISDAVFPFAVNSSYDVKVRRIGTTLTVTVTPVGGGAPQTYTLTHERIGRWKRGHIGWRLRAQDAELTNPVFRQL